MLIGSKSKLVFYYDYSSSKTTFTSARNSSRPQSSMVLLYPRSARRDGEDFVSALGPLYHSLTFHSLTFHSLTHTSQPTTVFPHLVTITGGLMGTEWQMVHLKVSRRICFSLTGKGLFFVRDTMYFNESFTLSTSCIKASSFSSVVVVRVQDYSPFPQTAGW